jgi:hypothetical protein
MHMDLLGTIEAADGATAGRNEWIALIGAHSSLAPVPPRRGINPFTKEPHNYAAAPDSARILLDGVEVGAIHWAQDQSNRLLVRSVAAVVTHVNLIAQEAASRLGWRFVNGSDA